MKDRLYEFKILTAGTGPLTSITVDDLDEWGAQGWRVVSVEWNIGVIRSVLLERPFYE